MFSFKKQKILTHSGKFHADDVFAIAILKIYFNNKISVTRSRQLDIVEKFKKEDSILVDVGREYNLEKKIFDHHQEGGAGQRDNGIPYASVGLIWKHYGFDICLKIAKNNSEIATEIWQSIDDSFISTIDASDTGYEDYFSTKTNNSSFTLDKIVNVFMTDYTEDFHKISFKRFWQLVKLAEILIKRVLKINYNSLLIKDIINNFYQKAEDKRIIVLDKGYPWKNFLVEKEEPLFVIFPEIETTNWMIQAVPIEKESMIIRKKFPQNWRGKFGEELEKATEIKGSVFCHSSGFLAVANNLENAILLAKKSV